MTVLDDLRRCYQDPDILWHEYTYSTPILEVVIAFARRNHLLGYVMLASLATALYTIVLGSLQVSATFYGATSFAADRAGAVVTLLLNIFLLLVSLTVAFRYGGASFLPRYPGTLASQLPYVLSSEKLKEDLRQVMPIQKQDEKIQRLRELGRRYGFGQFVNERDPHTAHLGVERNYVDCVRGSEHVRNQGLIWKTRW
jgi:hypothetical protein